MPKSKTPTTPITVKRNYRSTVLAEMEKLIAEERETGIYLSDSQIAQAISRCFVPVERHTIYQLRRERGIPSRLDRRISI